MTLPPMIARRLPQFGAPLALVLCLSACADDWPAPPPVDPTVFAEEHEEWRLNREARSVTPPGGAALWIGLWDLPEGETLFGSDPSLSIVLPEEDSPPIAGTLRRDGWNVDIVPAPGTSISVHEGEVLSGSMSLGHDRSENPTRLKLGSLGLRVHSEPGTDRLWLRVWDEDSPVRETFRLPDYFPVDTAWRVAAHFEPYDEPEILSVPDVTGGFVEFTAPGDLVFQKNGREHRLITTAGATSSAYFVLMWDSTATQNTYQGGRYLRVDFPDETGWTTIDFNRSYNAPCVFTAYSVCALPPRENWLKLPVTAGEMRPAK